MSNIHPPPDSAYNLPKVGEIRCYWTLLNSKLEFLYTDPVLTSHLQEQAPRLIGRSLLDFVHPEEKDTARDDISQGQMDRGKALWGSVTRVRYCRLSRVRQILGHTGAPHYWQDAEKVVYDEHYMEVDLVLSWAAQDLILCFIHASINLAPADNDQRRRTPWTNWCGTPVMAEKHIQQLFDSLCLWNPPSQSGHRHLAGSTQVRRAFQILSNRPGRPLLLHWPPDQDNQFAMTLSKAIDNANIDHDTQEGYSGNSQNGTASHAKTTCTRRFSSSTHMSSGNGGEQVVAESIFIPHGTIIFACHEVIPQAMPPHSTSPRSTNTTSSTSSTMQLGYPAAAPPVTAPRSNGYSSTSSTYYPPYSAASSQTTHRYPPINYGSYQTYPPPPPPASWNAEQNNSSSSYHSGQQWSSPAHSGSPLPAPAVSNLRSGSESYSTNGHNNSNSTSGPPSPWPPSQPPQHSPTSYMESAFSHPNARAASPGRYSTASATGPSAGTGGYAPTSPLPSLATLPPATGQELAGLGNSGTDVVPPSRRRVSPQSVKSDHGHSPYPSPSSLAATGPSETGRTTGSGRYSKGQGVMKCSSCKTTSSPEWRKGPSGKKELCNACGLRYARSRAKKDGQTPAQRKRKDKGLSIKRDTHSITPPSAVTAGTTSPHSAGPYLRGYDYRDGGSGYRDPALPPPTSSPNTELYPPPPPPIHGHSQSLHHVLDEESKVTPSPPPSAVSSYIHKQGYSSMPSPLSAHPPISSSALNHQRGPGSGAPSPAPIQMQHSHSSTSGPGSTTQLPPLAYVERMHHPVSLSSPINHSPLSAGVHPPASFERDSNRELPLPAGVRARSLLTGQ